MLAWLRNLFLPLAAGWVLAYSAVLFYGNWYFSHNTWIKAALLALPCSLLLWFALNSRWAKAWLFITCWWVFIYTATCISAKSVDLSRLGFTQVLDYEAGLVWVPTMALAWQIWQRNFRSSMAERARTRAIAQDLRIRRKLLRRETAYPLSTIGGSTFDRASVDLPEAVPQLTEE